MKAPSDKCEDCEDASQIESHRVRFAEGDEISQIILIPALDEDEKANVYFTADELLRTQIIFDAGKAAMNCPRKVDVTKLEERKATVNYKIGRFVGSTGCAI
mmetsp:Transcript_27442/g.39294  ORF Transcript_27442/g.39294 Transcript_27442/m.39294 type:complete len:102 (+) Transcript_27442:874-1179(+)